LCLSHRLKQENEALTQHNRELLACRRFHEEQQQERQQPRVAGAVKAGRSGAAAAPKAGQLGATVPSGASSSAVAELGAMADVCADVADVVVATGAGTCREAFVRPAKGMWHTLGATGQASSRAVLQGQENLLEPGAGVNGASGRPPSPALGAENRAPAERGAHSPGLKAPMKLALPGNTATQAKQPQMSGKDRPAGMPGAGASVEVRPAGRGQSSMTATGAKLRPATPGVTATASGSGSASAAGLFRAGASPREQRGPRSGKNGASGTGSVSGSGIHASLDSIIKDLSISSYARSHVAAPEEA
jgi:hypothetical protein